ncbi:MAG: putative aconitase/putative aconitase with swiveling domain [Pseudomonadales bacterium]|jgi:predicted aconitase/predicted aconitase with swiveling domain
MHSKNTPASGTELVPNPHGALLVSDVPLSFWGGISAADGNVIDEHHPLAGNNVCGRILVIPGSRGSCSGSSVLLELIDSNRAPAALVFSEAEEILVLGAMVANVMFGKSLPILQIDADVFSQLNNGTAARIDGKQLIVETFHGEHTFHGKRINIDAQNTSFAEFELTENDNRILNGDDGKAAQVAMQITLCMAQIQGATQLINIKQAHIDGCVYNGLSNLKFAEQLVAWGAKVKVPTTLNAISVDQKQWRAQGIRPEFGQPASDVGDAYVAMGAEKTFTCAPYLLNSAPALGDQIVWAESNAVAYANSVLGAKTQKYPDFLDICIALTGRAPFIGTHLDSGRLPAMSIDVPNPWNKDESFWPLLGYHVGLLASNDIPMVLGLESSDPTTDDLKAFSAAFATTSSVPMFHIRGITPEACNPAITDALNALNSMTRKTVSTNELGNSWSSLNTATTDRVDMVCLGNPHFSYTECAQLSALCSSHIKNDSVAIVVTLGRTIYQQCEDAGIAQALKKFGVQFVMDTCWCMLEEPVIPPNGSVLMTNSGKYAHYGPGLVKRPIHFGSLADCVEAACTGIRVIKKPNWLTT